MSDEPATVQIRARDVRPYHYGVWCTVDGSAPFTNEVVVVSWCRDGSGRVSIMLDSHNFLVEEPDALLDLVPLQPSEWATKRYGSWTLDGGNRG